MPSFNSAVMGIIAKEAPATQAIAARLHSVMSSLMSSHRAGAGATPKVARSVEKERVSSYELLRALGHCLVLAECGGLKAFLPLPEASRRLQPGEVRYLVAVDKWGSYDIPANVPWKRSVVKNITTGEKRYEQPSSWPSGRPPILTLNGGEH